MRLIPLEHPIPPGIEHARFRLRILTVDDLIKDYEAVMSSAERLREWPFETVRWPGSDLAWEEWEALPDA